MVTKNQAAPSTVLPTVRMPWFWRMTALRGAGAGAIRSPSDSRDHAGVVGEEGVVFVEGAGILGDRVEQAAEGGPRFAEREWAWAAATTSGRAVCTREWMANAASLTGRCRDDGALVVDQEEVGDADLREVHAERVDPEVSVSSGSRAVMWPATPSSKPNLRRAGTPTASAACGETLFSKGLEGRHRWRRGDLYFSGSSGRVIRAVLSSGLSSSILLLTTRRPCISPSAQHVLHVADLVGQQVQLAGQALNLRFGAAIHFEIEFAAQAVFRVLAVLAHHDDRRLDGRQHRQEKIEQDEGIRIPGSPARSRTLMAV